MDVNAERLNLGFEESRSIFEDDLSLGGGGN